MLQFEQTFMDFLLEHQERHNRTYHFLILMNSILNAAKRIQHYYLTGALRGNLGLAGSTNVQGEEVAPDGPDRRRRRQALPREPPDGSSTP